MSKDCRATKRQTPERQAQRAPSGRTDNIANAPHIQDPVTKLLDALYRTTGYQPRRRGSGWQALCPVHGDRNPSLAIHVKGNRILVVCQSQNCSASAIVDAVGLTLADLFLDPPSKGNGETARWKIRDLEGKTIAEHVRFDRDDGGKNVLWYRNGTSGLKGLKLADLPLYGAEMLADLPDGALVVLCEGEKATDAARRAGYHAVGTVTGANLIPSNHVLKPLVRFKIVLWPDADADGVRHMRRIGEALVRLGVGEILWVNWPDAPEKGDAADIPPDHVKQLVEGATEEMPDRMRELAESAEIVSYNLDAENLNSTEVQVLLPGRHTEGGAGDLFANQHHGELRYCRAWGSWLHWTGTHWQRDVTGEAERRAKATIMGLYAAASQEQDDGQRQRLISWARKLDTSRTARAILDWASTDARIAVRPEDLDQDLWALNCTNGTLDLHTGELREHRPEDLITYCVPNDYDPNAEYPAWEAHLEHFLPDEDVRRQIQRDLGVSLVGANLAEVLSVWHGTGDNAKSTTAEVIRQVLGDYATAAAPNLLIQRKHEQHPTELADLFGKRLVTSEEIPEGAWLDEAKVKSLTGGGTQKARYSRRDFFSFPRTWSLLLDCNHKPRIRGSDEGIWRRVRIVPWTVSAKGWAGRKPQDQVIAELMAEAPGILRWLVKGLKDWQADPSWVAERVTVATADYRQEQDRLARWLEEHCEVDKSHTESFKSLWQDYQAWCELNSIKPLGRGTFGSRLESAGHPPASGKGNKATREGLRLLSDIEREAKAKEAEAEAKKAAKEEADRKAREEAARRAAEDDSSDGNSDSGAGVNSVKSSPGNATRGDTRELQGQHLPHLTHETDNGDETPVDRNDPDTWPTCGVKGCGKRNPKVNADGQCPDCEGVGDKPPIARFNKQKTQAIGWAP